jgi:hypothetical protein
MTSRLMLMCAGLLVLPGVTYGQIERDQQPAAQQGQQAAAQQVTLKDLNALEAKLIRLDAAVRILGEKLDNLANPAANQNNDLEAIKSTAGEPEQPSQSVEERLGQIENDLADHGNMLRRLTARAETGDVYWRFDTNSQPARQEFNRALNSTVPTKAKFVVRNRTDSDSWIVVNGRMEFVEAGGDITLEVEPGTITARLPHQTQSVALYAGFPQYFQSAVIKNRPARATPNPPGLNPGQAY